MSGIYDAPISVVSTVLLPTGRLGALMFVKDIRVETIGAGQHPGQGREHPWAGAGVLTTQSQFRAHTGSTGLVVCGRFT